MKEEENFEEETTLLVIKTNPFVLLQLKLDSLSREEDLLFEIEISNLERWLNENIMDSKVKKMGDNIIDELKDKSQEEQRMIINKFRGKIRRG